MRALRFDRFGPPGQLQVQEIERPHSQREEVVVQVHAAGVNPSDVKNVAGMMEGTTLPLARQVAISPGLSLMARLSFSAPKCRGTGGDIGFTRDGSHAEYLLLPSEAVRQKTSICP